MRIVYIVTRADVVGGVGVHVCDLAAAMRDAGHEATVLAGAPGPLARRLAERGIPFRDVPALVRPIAPHRDVAALRQLRTRLRELRPDLVSTHSSKAGWLGRLAAWSLGIPVLFTAHGWAFTAGVPAGARRFYASAERLAAPLAAHIVTVSEYDRRLALRHRIAAPDRITAVRNGVLDLGTAAPVPTTRPGPPRLVMVGRFSPQKDHAGLLHALGELRALDWVADLIGDGPLHAEAMALAGRLGLGDRVRFLGAREDARERLCAADLHVLTSRWEGLPYSVLEAMCAGLPVLASDVGGVAEAVRDGVTGFLVPRDDHAGLVGKLRLLLSDAGLRRRLGAAGRRRYEEEFRFEVMFERTTAVYRRVIAAGSRRRPAGRGTRRR